MITVRGACLLGGKEATHIKGGRLDYACLLGRQAIQGECKVDCGPTVVGDGDIDPDLMSFLNAKRREDRLTKIVTYTTDLAPRCVLNLLEKKGWSVVSSTGFEQTCVWTLHKDE